MDMSTDPPFYPKRVPIDWAWAEDFNDILKFRASVPEKFWRGVQNFFWAPPPTPPPLDPLQLDPYIYQSKALDVRMPINSIGIWT